MTDPFRLSRLAADDPTRFPPVESALRNPNGLLAFGGDLSSPRLLAAYSRGIFPWFSEGEPMLWWSPDPRCVFRTDTLRINRSLRRQLAGKSWRVTVDHAFEKVIRACAAPRATESQTWIVPTMIDAYVRLHSEGHAHSVEVWDEEKLVGGIYGLAIGKLFCGESMFSVVSGGSKLALVSLARLLSALDFPLIDAQVANAHTLGLGALEMSRSSFMQEISGLVKLPCITGTWSDWGTRLASGLLD